MLGVAFSLVFVLARWLGGGSDGSADQTPTAEQAGSQVQATKTVTPGASEPTATATAGTGKNKPTLAAPQGRCEPSDVVIAPAVRKGAEAGRDVRLRLSLQTKTSEACTWRVSRKSLVVRITQGGKQVWSTQQCPAAVPAQSVVVRRAVATVVNLTWAEARESRANCTRRADWALPGDYTISAAPLGGEPAEAAFSLLKPKGKVIEVTPNAKQDATRSDSEKQGAEKQGSRKQDQAKPSRPTN